MLPYLLCCVVTIEAKDRWQHHHLRIAHAGAHLACQLVEHTVVLHELGYGSRPHHAWALGELVYRAQFYLTQVALGTCLLECFVDKAGREVEKSIDVDNGDSVPGQRGGIVGGDIVVESEPGGAPQSQWCHAIMVLVAGVAIEVEIGTRENHWRHCHVVHHIGGTHLAVGVRWLERFDGLKRIFYHIAVVVIAQQVDRPRVQAQFALSFYHQSHVLACCGKGYSTHDGTQSATYHYHVIFHSLGVVTVKKSCRLSKAHTGPHRLLS